MSATQEVRRVWSAPVAGYAAAVLLPVAITYLAFWMSLPPFVFEHLAILVVLAVAIPCGLGPAIVAAIVCVVSDNLLLRDPVGSPTITGTRDVIDLLLFATVAVVVSELVRRAHAARAAAQEAAGRERRAREERDRLIATITHDLATPLNVLAATLHVARQREGTTRAELSQLLDRLETASARATSLVKTLSDARALDSDGLHLEMGTHDLRTLVAPIVQMLDRLSTRHPVLLETPDRPVPIEGDADRLQRVLENLLNNAIKYSPQGGPVDVSVAVEGGDAVLRVRDRGIGVPPESLPRIFERAYRAPGAAMLAPGLGLGLSIAAQVVARHGGSIAAAAAPPQGTVVTVRLPLARQPARPAASAAVS